MNRIKNEIERKEREGRVVEFPLLDKNGDILWIGKYPDMQAIEVEKKQVSAKSQIGMRAWQREYLLKLVPEEGQVVKDEWIQYYDNLPETKQRASGTGVDLAISKKSTADYTAMVSGRLFPAGVDIPKVYIMPNPVNEHLSGFETTSKGKSVSLALGGGTLTPLWVEDVAYQRMQVEAMERAGLPVTGVKVGSDKCARLTSVASYIQNGTVLFPRSGCEDLILQLTGFGVEAHDDLADAFVYAVQGLLSDYAKRTTFEWL